MEQLFAGFPRRSWSDYSLPFLARPNPYTLPPIDVAAAVSYDRDCPLEKELDLELLS